MTPKGQGLDPDIFGAKYLKVVTQLSLGPNISKRAGDRGLVTMGHDYQMGYGESNGHVTDDVT